MSHGDILAADLRLGPPGYDAHLRLVPEDVRDAELFNNIHLYIKWRTSSLAVLSEQYCPLRASVPRAVDKIQCKELFSRASLH